MEHYLLSVFDIIQENKIAKEQIKLLVSDKYTIANFEEYEKY